MKDIKKPDFIKEVEGQKGHLVGAELLISLALFFVGSLVSAMIQMPAMAVYMLQSKEYLKMLQSGKFDTELILSLSASMPDWMFVVQLLSEIGLLFVVIGYCRLIERRRLFTMGFIKKGIGKELFRGILFGAVLCFGVWGLECIQHMPKVKPVLPQSVILLFFLGYLVQGFAQEVFFRGYLLVSLSKGHSMISSIFINAVVFSLLSGMSAESTMLAYINTFFFGVLMALLFVQYENIWCVGILHGLWNFGRFMFPESFGMDSYYCTIILVVFLLLIGYIINRQGKYVTVTQPVYPGYQEMPYNGYPESRSPVQEPPKEVVRPMGVLPEEQAEEKTATDSSETSEFVFDKEYFKD